MDQSERIERRLKLSDFRVFMAVVRAGSMGKAAEYLGTSQPAVSRSIGDLEHALGILLFDRSKRGVEPTQYGRALMHRGIAIFDELRQGVKDIEFLADPTAGELRVGCTEATAAGPVFAAITRLIPQHPRLVFHVVTETAANLERKLANREVELLVALMSGPAVQEPMVAEVLFEDSFVVAAGLRNRWVHRRRVKLADLVNEPWTLPPLESFAGAVADKVFRATGLQHPRITVVALSANMRNKLLATGQFLTLLPRFALRVPGQPAALKSLPIYLPDGQVTVAVVTLRNRTLSPLAQLFIKTARAAASSMAKNW